MTELAREFSTEKRKQLAQKGHALPDGSFPIVTKEDLSNAIQAYGRASNKAKAKAHIIKRAKALGATSMLPDDWKGSDDAAQVKLYYFKGRNTPIAATSAKQAREKKKRGGDEIVKVRTPTEEEKKKMRNGEWVRTRRDGKQPGKSKYGKGRGYGPPRDKASNMIKCTHEDCERSFLDENAMEDHAEVVHSFSDMMRSARDVVREKYGRDSYIRDMGNDWIVVGMYNDGDPKLLKVSYSEESGEVKMGEDEMEVIHRNAYLPASREESASLAMTKIGVEMSAVAPWAATIGGHPSAKTPTTAVGGKPPTDNPHEFAQEEGQKDPLICSDCGRNKSHSIHS